MVFVETRTFSRKLSTYLDDEGYRKLQAYMLENPDAGAVIRGSGGIRKLRWSIEGKGKRGGIRVIYFIAVTEKRFLMLTLYAKNELVDLSAQEIKLLKRIAEEWSNA